MKSTDTAVTCEPRDLALFQASLSVTTAGRGLYEITTDVASAVRASRIEWGICHLFIQHTSASLVITENADPDVLRDLEVYAVHHIPDGDPHYAHVAEGPDDMAAHIRSVLTNVSLTLPVRGGACALGTWQGIFVWEHRRSGHRRSVILTAQGRIHD